MALILLFTLLAALISSVYNISSKFMVTGGRLRALPAALLVQILAGVIALGFLLMARIPPAPDAMPAVIATAFVALTGFILMMIALTRDDASVVGPVLGLKVIFLAVLEPVIRHNPIGLGVWLGAVASLIGLTFISQTDRWSLHPRDLLRPGVLIMALAALIFTFSDFFLKLALEAWKSSLHAAMGQGMASMAVAGYALTGQGMVSAVILLALYWSRSPVLGKWGPGNIALPRSAVWPLLISGTAAFGYQYFFFQAFSRSNGLTWVNIIYNTRNLMVVVFMALLVLGGGSTVERAGWRAYTYRIIGAVLTLSAVALSFIGAGK